MIRIIAILMLVTFPTFCFSQKIKNKCTSTRHSKECYSINKKTKQKVGDYFKTFKSSNDTIAKGKFSTGVKSGEWSIFNDKNEKIIVYDFESKRVIKNSFNTENDSSLVFIDNDYLLQKVDISSRFLGTDLDLITTLIPSIVGPSLVESTKNFGRAIALVMLDEYGKIEKVSVEKAPSKVVENLIIKSFKPLTDSWFPAIHDGKNKRSVLIVVFDILGEPIGPNPTISNSYTKHCYIVVSHSVRIN